MNILVYVFITVMFIFNTVLSILNYKNRLAPIPEVVNDVYNKKEYDKWLEYRMENHRFGMLKRVFDFVVFIALLAFGFFPWLASQFQYSEAVNILLFFLVYYLITFLTGIPFSYYNTFSIEERFGFNKATRKTFFLDKIKNTLLTFIFGGGLIYLLFTLYSETTNFILYAWLALIVIILLVNVLYTSVIVPLFNKLTPLEDGELKDKITAVATACGFRLNNIYIMDASKRSSRLNAYFSGLGKTKKIVLYDTLVDKMSDDEIVAVLAHEIGHNVRHHVPINFLVSIANISVLLFVLQFALTDVFSTSFGFTTSHFGFGIIIFSVLMEPISVFVGLITSNLSRRFEYQADAYAKDKTSGDAMIGALKVLGKENFANLTPHPAVVKLTFSHPTLKDRIEALL